MIPYMKNIAKIMLAPLFFINNSLRQFRLFVFPNLFKLFKKNTKFLGNYPKCYQLLKLSGRGKISIGDDCHFGSKLGGFHKCGYVELQTRFIDAKIIIGNHVVSNNNIFICSANNIEIGDETLIGQYVTIMDFDAHGIDPLKRVQLGEIGKIIIGNNVWIGNNVTILKNVEIGDNSIIAAGAVVIGKFPSNVIIGGVPAKIIRNI